MTSTAAARLATSRLGSLIASPAMRVDPEHYNPIHFYRSIFREIPGVISRYRLEELITKSQLCNVVADMFRANGAVKEQRAVDLLVIKGREEMNLITANHKQRHHLIAKYVHEPQAKAAAAEKAKSITTSKFLQDFFVSN